MNIRNTLLPTAATVLISAAPLIGYASAQNAADDTIVITEQDWIIISTAPTDDMHDAESAYLRHEYDRAAASIHKAAAWVRTESTRAAGATKVALNASAEELDTLAQDIRSDAVKSTKRMREIFARASARLARLYGDLATKAHTDGDDKKSGSYLQAASQTMSHAAAWAGGELKQGKKFTLRQADAAAAKLKQGASWVAAQGSEALSWVRSEVQRIGTDIQSKDWK